MKKNKILIYASRIFVVGFTIFIISLIASGFNFREISGIIPDTSELTPTYNLSNIDTISIDTSQTNVEVSQSNGSAVLVKYENTLGKKYTGERIDNTLKLSVETENLQLDLDTNKNILYVEIPLSFNGDIYITSTNGDIKYSGENLSNNVTIFATVGNIDITNAVFREQVEITNGNGNIEVNDVEYTKMVLKSSNGSINVDRVTGKDSLSIETDTGSYSLKNVDSNSMTVKSNAGEGLISNSSIDEGLTISSDTGNLQLLNSKTGSDLVVTSTTGNQKYQSVECKRIYLNSTTGSIKGSFIGNKNVYNIQADSRGKITIPETIGNLQFDIISYKGEINIRLIELVD